MSIKTANRVHANCQVLGATGGFVTGSSTKGVRSAVRVGVGVYDLTLEQELAANNRVCGISLMKANPFNIRFVSVKHPSADVVRVGIVDRNGAAQDENFMLTLYAIPEDN